MTRSEQLAAIEAATKGEVYDQQYEWMYEAVETHETIDEFIQSSAGWTESCTPTRGELAGLPFVAWRRMQALRGQPREALSVIDLGDVRYAIRVDLSDY